VRVSRFDETCDPHPALRAALSQWERVNSDEVYYNALSLEE